jgi:hypothetical protein
MKTFSNYCPSEKNIMQQLPTKGEAEQEYLEGYTHV